MGEPTNKKLYNSIKKYTNKKFDKPSANKSSWIVKNYKSKGGKYSGIKGKGLQRYYSQEGGKSNFEKALEYREYSRKFISPEYNEKADLYINKIIKHSDNIDKLMVYKDKLFKLPIVQSGNGKSQFYGKKSKVMVKVPVSVKNATAVGYKLIDKGFKGGDKINKTGFKRLNQLATKNVIPIEDIRYIKAWFARHIYTSYPSYKNWVKNGRPLNDTYYHNKRGILAWYLWAGTPAFKWVNSHKIVNLLNKHYPNKNYKSIKLTK
jgi:hypothetical protein